MEETNSAQKIVNEALKDDSWDIGVYKIAALKTSREPLRSWRRLVKGRKASNRATP